LILCAVAISIISTGAARAQTVWNGPPISFSQPSGADPNLPINQDRMTPNVWITRGTSQGIYNIEQEPGFTHFLSPKDTQWADGTTLDYLTLSYTDWNSWAKGVHAGPPSTVGVNAVVHLISDNIYLDLKFTSWDSGGVGGFSYIRSTAAVPEPSSAALVSAAGLILLQRRRHRKGQVRA
jgi:hypothetical protein